MIRHTFTLAPVQVAGAPLVLTMAMPSASAHVAFLARLDAGGTDRAAQTDAMLDLLASCLVVATHAGTTYTPADVTEARTMLDGLGLQVVAAAFADLMARLAPDEATAGK